MDVAIGLELTAMQANDPLEGRNLFRDANYTAKALVGGIDGGCSFGSIIETKWISLDASWSRGQQRNGTF